MQVGIIGLPSSGKTTIYNALTGGDVATGSFLRGRCQVATATVDVPDPRVAVLSDMFVPAKTTYAKIQFNDISGLSRREDAGNSLDAQTLHALSQCDALLQVVRAFHSQTVPEPANGVDPETELADLRLELVLSDLDIVERRLERIHAGLRKARSDEKQGLQTEALLLQRCRDALEAGQHLVDVEMTEDERALLGGFGFLTIKPAVVVVNIGEDDQEPEDLSWTDHHRETSAVALRGSIEMEISQLASKDAILFMDDYGIVEPTLHAMVRECYRLLGLMSFFTVGEDEVRAWTIRRGATAVEAAGVIHSDLARGFIRAEVLSYEDMLACRTMAEARRRGLLRLEGKDYVVQDGDVMSIRFNV